jgi:hypothetical protein
MHAANSASRCNPARRSALEGFALVAAVDGELAEDPPHPASSSATTIAQRVVTAGLRGLGSRLDTKLSLSAIVVRSCARAAHG